MHEPTQSQADHDTCINCGDRVPNGALYCPTCGQPRVDDLPPDMTCHRCGTFVVVGPTCQYCGIPADQCVACGELVPTDALYCPQCGWPRVDDLPHEDLCPECGLYVVIGSDCWQCGRVPCAPGEHRRRMEADDRAIVAQTRILLGGCLFAFLMVGGFVWATVLAFNDRHIPAAHIWMYLLAVGIVMSVFVYLTRD